MLIAVSRLLFSRSRFYSPSTMITALGVGPLNSLGTVPNRWLYIFESLWDGDDQERQSPEESAFQTQRLVAMVSHPSP